MATQRKSFGKLVHVAWKRSGMTSDEFAAKLGVRQPRVFEIFKQDSMTERLFRRCAKALGMRVDVKLVRGRS